MRIKWLAGARANLFAIIDYIAADDPVAAAKVDEIIHRLVTHLGTTPRIGRAGRVKGTRELVISGTPYIVAYRIMAKEVRIIRVIHGARQWPKRM